MKNADVKEYSTWSSLRKEFEKAITLKNMNKHLHRPAGQSHFLSDRFAQVFKW